MNLPKDIFPPFPEMRPGEVWLVGAGPGDPRLLTVMAVHALAAAEVVIHDALVDPRILRLARAGAEIHHAGKRGGKPSPHQRDINELIIAEAKSGKRVLRLKGGDPFVFGRGGEEAMALVRAGHSVPHRAGAHVGPRGAGARRHSGDDARNQSRHHPGRRASRARRGGRRRVGGARPHRPADRALHGDAAHRGHHGGVPARRASAPTRRSTIISSATLEAERVIETRLATAAADARAAALEPPTLIVVGAIAALRAELVRGMVK